MKLNIGSGIYPAPGWINMDLNYLGTDWEVNVVASATQVPFKGGAADRVYFGHVLEHLSYYDGAPCALREAWRVLKYGGQLGVVGPAMDLALLTEQPENIIEAIKASPAPSNPAYDPDTPAGFGHLWEANVDNTYALVQSVFPNAIVVPVTNIQRSSGWPNREVSLWQVAIVASKESDR